jgi:membrane-bound lytic murein transglycosylase D
MDARTAARDDLILHTVKKGETISKISSRYQVPAELIVAWNGLPSVHKITAGQQLALYMNSTSPRTVASQVQTAAGQDSANDDNVVVLSRTKKQAAQSVQSSETAVTWYQVRQGDSLWTISRRFNISPDHIRRWNNLKSNRIHPGSRLKLIDV